MNEISSKRGRGPKASNSDSEVSRKQQITKSIILDFGIFEQDFGIIKRRDVREKH